jgi:hypothetical protein
VGANGGPTTDPDGGGIRAGGGYEPGEQALPNLQCTLTGGRPGETSFQCELSLTGLADEAELPTEAHVLILTNGPPRALTAPIAYVAETETHVRFVFLLENAQVGGSHSLRISVADERGTHGANVPLTPTSFNATIGLTADQLGGVP